MAKALEPVGKVVSAALGIKTPKTPSIPPPTPMADEADPALAAARRRRIAADRARSGRLSTVLGGSDDQESLG